MVGCHYSDCIGSEDPMGSQGEQCPPSGTFSTRIGGLKAQVVVTNVLEVKLQDPRRGTKDKGKLKYLIQFRPRDLVMDPSLCLSMLAYPVKVIGTMDNRLQQVIASEQLNTHANAPPCLQMMDSSLPSMNVPSHVIGGSIVPLSAAMIGGSNSAANRMNAKLVYDVSFAT